MREREDEFGSYEPMIFGQRFFHDRQDAGEKLAERLTKYEGRRALVLGLPRGGVPVAAKVAERLGAELDVIVARKLGAPGQSELAIGAVTADGTAFLNQSLIDVLSVSDAYLEYEEQTQRAEAERREQRFRRGLAPLSPEGRTVIVVDDGVATGATLRAAIRALHGRAGELVVAVPVGSVDACEQIEKEVDTLVVLHRPEPFYAVGLHYEHFEQTSDEEVEQLLAEQRVHRRASAGQGLPSPPAGAR